MMSSRVNLNVMYYHVLFYVFILWLQMKICKYFKIVVTALSRNVINRLYSMTANEDF